MVFTLSNSVTSVVIKEILNQEDQRPTYQITFPSFDGPMDLLLHLIKEHELDIYDIPISKITKEYLAYLEIMQSLNLEIAGDFLVMAATLMQIKSRMLLPVDPTPDQPEEDPRLELMRRLVEYKKFKDAADQLLDLEKTRVHLLGRSVPTDLKAVGEEEHLEEVTLFGLLAAFKDVLIHSQEDVTAELLRPEVTVSQRINDLMDLAPNPERRGLQAFPGRLPDQDREDHLAPGAVGTHPPEAGRVVQEKIFGEIEVQLFQDEIPETPSTA